MAKREILIIFALLAFVFSNELEDAEQKKRGAGKANPLNAIPTGAQKPDYSYNIYSQNPSVQSPVQSYQSPSQNSFYPSQDNSYYNSNTESSNPSQSQVNVPSQNTQTQFLPINFIPSPGYQSKYQIIPTKNGNIQLAIVQQPPAYSQPIVQYPQNIFSSNAHAHPGNQLFQFGTPGHYTFNPNIQNLPISQPLIGQPSAMILLPPPNPSLYNNLLYPNPSQSFYNYYPSTSQAKYSYPSGGLTPPGEYEKGISQSIQKEDSDANVQSGEYTSPSESNSGYKSNYSRRSAFSKYK